MLKGKFSLTPVVGVCCVEGETIVFLYLYVIYESVIYVYVFVCIQELYI